MAKRAILFLLGILFVFSAIAGEIKEFDLFGSFEFELFVQTDSEAFVSEFYPAYEMKIVEINMALKNNEKAKLIFHTDSGDRSFIVTKLLSSRSPGNTTYVYELEGGEKAIRLPRFISKLSLLKSNIWKFSQYFIEGFVQMKSQPFNLVAVLDHYAYPGTPPQFIVVDKVDILFDLREYWTYMADPENLENAKMVTTKIGESGFDIELINKFLVDELINTWGVTALGDYHAGQIGFTSDGRWVLFDYSAGMMEVDIGDDRSLSVIPMLIKTALKERTPPQSIMRVVDEAQAGIIKMREKAIRGEIDMPTGRDFFTDEFSSWCGEALGPF